MVWCGAEEQPVDVHHPLNSNVSECFALVVVFVVPALLFASIDRINYFRHLVSSNCLM